jgi:hypothetical protein
VTEVYRPYNYVLRGTFTNRKTRQLSAEFAITTPWRFTGLSFPSSYFANYLITITFERDGSSTLLGGMFNPAAWLMAGFGATMPVEPVLVFPKDSKIRIDARLADNFEIGRKRRTIRAELIGDEIHELAKVKKRA